MQKTKHLTGWKPRPQHWPNENSLLEIYTHPILGIDGMYRVLEAILLMPQKSSHSNDNNYYYYLKKRVIIYGK